MTKVDHLLRLLRELEEGHDRTLIPLTEGRTTLMPDVPPQGRLEMLFSDDESDEVPDEPVTFVPTAEPIATVLPPDRTKGHVRGYIPNPRTNRSVSFASTLERVCALSLIANADIQDVEDQPAAQSFTNANGELHSHRPDFRFSMGHNRQLIAVAVRPSHLLDKEDLRKTISIINDGYLEGFADEMIILTEHQLTYALGWNSKSIMRALRGRNKEDCAWLKKRLHNMHGWINIRALIEGIPNSLGWNAVWCLIFDGILKPFRRDTLLPYCPIVSVDHSKLEAHQ